MIVRRILLSVFSLFLFAATALAEDPSSEAPPPKHKASSKEQPRNDDPSKWQLRPMTAKQFKNAWPYLSPNMASIHGLTDAELETMRKEGEKQTGTGKPIVMTLPERVAEKRRQAKGQ